MAERDSFGSFLLGFIAGALAGAVASVLYAPKTGEETRNAIRDMKDDLLEKANVSLDEAYKQAENAAKDARDRFETLANSTKARAEEMTRRGQDFLDENKEKFRGAVHHAEEEISNEIPTITND